MVALLGMVFLGVGILFVVVSVVGVIRFPDFCSRVHAAGIADSVGVALVMLGLAMQYEFSVFTLKVLLLICLMWITCTTTCNMLVSAALNAKSDD